MNMGYGLVNHVTMPQSFHLHHKSVRICMPDVAETKTSE